MQILEQAITKEGGVGKLANALGLRQGAVSNWRVRGIPRAWGLVLESRYGDTSKPKQPLPITTTPKEPAHG